MNIVTFSENADLAQMLMKTLFAEWPLLFCVHQKCDLLRILSEIDSACVVADLSSFSGADYTWMSGLMHRNREIGLIAIGGPLTIGRARHAGIRLDGFLRIPVSDCALAEFVGDVCDRIQNPAREPSDRLCITREPSVKSISHFQAQENRSF